MSPQGANQLQPASYAIAELRVDAGQAVPVSREAELAWLPWSGMQLAVTLPPDPTDLRQTVEQNVRAVLITLTGVALVLAVLALTNSAGSAAMLRRPEFALRRAVGARRCHIAALVAVEATLTGLLGGVVGAYGAVLSVLGVTAARHWTPLLHPVTVALGVLGGALVGVLGGLVAARRAGRGDLAVALRSL